MTRIIDSTIIYDGTPVVLNVNGGEQVKMQGVGVEGDCLLIVALMILLLLSQATFLRKQI